ncbi:phosphatidylinositol kinase-related protein kinase TOR [Acrasis kona]|uniref:Serine/threonine-protein kinase TOR n=1 Tax=Acrasis kona TaxID=1008807 RepID=A0AAW2ZAG8_9EUKA
MSNVILKDHLLGLRSKNEATRIISSNKLRTFVEKTSREQNKESFSNFIEDLNIKLQELVNSRDTTDRIGAIMAIDKLIDIDYDDQRKILRFSNYLRNILTNQHSDATTVPMVTRALGRLAKASDSSNSSKTLTAEWVEFETKRALEWLEGDSRHKDDGRRYAAVYVLKELAENAPTLFYAHVQSFLEHIWNGLRDTNYMVREGSVLALRAVLALISDRQSNVRVVWYLDIWNKTREGYSNRNASAESIHGSLLATGELLRNTGSFMNDQFEDVCKTVMKYTESTSTREQKKDKLIRAAIIQLIPQLARYYKSRFNEKYLKQSITFFLVLLKSGVDRPPTFIALGELALQVGQPIAVYLTDIIGVIKEAISPKRSKVFVPEALMCLSMVGKSVPGEQKFIDAIGELLDLMFAAGLSSTLTDSLSSLVETFPTMLKPVQDRLLDLISIILARVPYNPVKSTVGSAIQLPDTNDEQTVALALRTLGVFNMKGHNLTDFVRDCVVNFLDDDSTNIRQEAAKTCCKLLVSQGKPPLKGHFGYVVGDVLTKLLTVGITDPDPLIRHAVLFYLDSRFDHYLALADNLRCLFIALNDESFEIREVAISIIGRLGIRNPAYVLPSLRKTLLQLLTELEFSEDPTNKEESARMLGHLITSAPRLIKPYVSSILKVLKKRINDPNPNVSTFVLDTTGKLSVVGGNAILPFLDELLPLVMETLQDQSSSSKRGVAVRTLGQLVESTGYVIEPYLKYPNLLNILLGALKAEEEWNTRKEVIKVLGILGAIDPYKHKQLHLNGALDNKSSSTSSAPVEDMPGMSPSSEEYYPTVAFTALIRILNDPSLKLHHMAVIQAVMFIFTSLGMKCVPFLPQVMPPFLNLIRHCEINKRRSLFQQLSEVVSIVKQHIRGYLDEIFLLVQDFWNSDDSLKLQIILLEEEICMALNEEFKPYLPKVIPQLLGVLQHDMTGHLHHQYHQYHHHHHHLMNHDNMMSAPSMISPISNLSNTPSSIIGSSPIMTNTLMTDEQQLVSMKALHALYIFGRHLEDYLYLVIPAVVRLFEHGDARDDLKICAIKTIGKLSRILNFSEYSSRIIHPLTRSLKCTSQDLRNVAMDTLCCFVYQMGSDFVIFIPMTTKVLSQYHIVHYKYNDLIHHLCKSMPLPDENQFWADNGFFDHSEEEEMRNGGLFGTGAGNGGNNTDSSDEVTSHAPQSNSSGALPSKMHVNQTNLRRTWEASQRSTKEDWVDWIRGFSVELLRQSPSPALRSCSALAQVYHPLTRELFNAGFVSCWTELDNKSQEDVVRALEQAFSSPSLPNEVLQTLLNLAEFMEHDEKPLPIDISALGALANQCQCYAKGLHYKEIEFQENPSKLIEDLISINNQLQQHEAAMGILKYAQRHHAIQLKESWYEKLQRWHEAYEAYDAKQRTNPNHFQYTLGKMRCLRSMGEWEKLLDLCQQTWKLLSDLQSDSNQSSSSVVINKEDPKVQMAPMAAAAAWNLGEWDFMKECVSAIEENSSEGTFFRAILCIHRNEFLNAQHFIDKNRIVLDAELAALVGESYNRAYDLIVRVQQLSELEETIEYKQLLTCHTAASLKKQSQIQKIWNDRLRGCKRHVEHWQNILTVRKLVISPEQDIDVWIKFASLCRKSNKMQLSEKTLLKLIRVNLSNAASTISQQPETLLQFHHQIHPKVTFEYIKHLWASHSHQISFGMLQRFTKYLENNHRSNNHHHRHLHDAHQQQMDVNGDYDESANQVNRLLARCYLQLGSMQQYLSQVQLQQKNDALQNIRGGHHVGANHSQGYQLTPSTSSNALYGSSSSSNQQNAPVVLLDEQHAAQILDSLRIATEYDREWYKAWHAWAMMNSEVVAYYEYKLNNNTTNTNALSANEQHKMEHFIIQHLVNAIQGLL